MSKKKDNNDLGELVHQHFILMTALEGQLEWMFKYIKSWDCPDHYKVTVPDHVKEEIRYHYKYLQIIHNDIDGSKYTPKVSL